VHKHKRGGGGDDGQPENGERVNQNRVVSSKRNDLMRFDSAAGVKQQDGKAFAFRVEIGIARNVQAPVFGGFLRGVAKQQGFRRGAFAERYDFVFVGLRVEFEGRDKRGLSVEGRGLSVFDIHF